MLDQHPSVGIKASGKDNVGGGAASMVQWDDTVDAVIVGSGGGGLCASLVLSDAGKEVLVLEKTDKIGGSTAMSGGTTWIPNHPLQSKHHVEDSYELGRTYFDALLNRPHEGKGATPERIEMFLREGPSMVQYLLDRGMKYVRCEGWSDYHCELPGGHVRSRTLAAEIFDARRLGEWNNKLRRGPITIPIRGAEGRNLTLYRRTLTGFLTAVRYAFRRIYMRLTSAQLVGLGTAVVGRMLEMALQGGVRIETESPVTALVMHDGRVQGVIASLKGKTMRIRARDGVIANSGGFSHDTRRRQKYTPALPDIDFSHASPGDTGEVLDMMVALGAATDNLDQAIWVTTSQPPGRGISMDANPTIAKPHVIVVGPNGKRFGNEAGSYMQFGQDQLAAGAVPGWAIIESRHRQRYIWAGASPGTTPQAWFESGYMKRAGTIEDLAQQIGLDPRVLQDTITRFNTFTHTGYDEDFKRGSREYDRWYGDPTNKPNASLGAIEKPPFYAVAVYPGDIGTFGGVVTDQYARVVDDQGNPIAGLYAAGNCTAGVAGTHYPGAGGSLGPSFTFGYVAAQHLLQNGKFNRAP